MTIATADKSGEPWISPIVFGYDKNYIFYWFSDKDSKHSKLINQNSKVAIVIFDSKAPEGTGDGVYMVGEASEVSQDQLEHAIKTLSDRFGKEPQPKEKFLGDLFDIPGNSVEILELLYGKSWMIPCRKTKGCSYVAK